ncbi:MAG: STAS domain-containing protein [bacterium]|nr:STAS domain-containing protein [bacterium]
MNISFYDHEEHKVIVLDGEFNFYNTTVLKKAVHSVTDGKYQSVVVDVGNVSYMDSSAIGVFFAAMRRMKLSNGQFYLMNVGKELQEVLDLVNVSIPEIEL